jgi:hypothetical protein
METLSPSVRLWAQRLLGVERANSSAAASDTAVAVRVSEKLRISLTRFVGPDGFTALQRRALALARREVPSLQAVKVTAEGRLEGIEEVDHNGEAATAVTAHLLGLLVAFVGEPLTVRLVRDAFRDTPGGESEDL